MKFICETFSRVDVTFRDESNETSSTMIVYIIATVIVPNHLLIVRSNASIATVLLRYHSCGGGFVIRLHLIFLISGQKAEKFS